MNRTEKEIQAEKKRRKADDAKTLSEDRTQLLETIREMIDFEFERRGVNTKGSPHAENPPPAGTGTAHENRPRPRRTFRQWLLSIFTGTLL